MMKNLFLACFIVFFSITNTVFADQTIFANTRYQFTEIGPDMVLRCTGTQLANCNNVLNTLAAYSSFSVSSPSIATSPVFYTILSIATVDIGTGLSTYLYLDGEVLNLTTPLNTLTVFTYDFPPAVVPMWGNAGLFGTTSMLAAVTTGVQDTATPLWPLFALMGVPIAFILATKTRDFIMLAGAEQRRRQKYTDDLAAETNTQKQWDLTEKYRKGK